MVMKRKTSLIISLLLMIVAVAFINGCSENSVSGPDNPAESAGIYVNDIQWAPVKPEFINNLKALKKEVTAGKLITAAKGGVVGGANTFNNKVVFPPGAVDKDTYVTVTVNYDKKINNLAYIEFLPSGSFNKPVEVTLSWDFLDVDISSVADLKAYFSQDGGDYWFPVESSIDVNYDTKTAKFLIDHFTRFGWGI